MATKLKPRKMRVLSKDERAAQFPLSYPPETAQAVAWPYQFWEYVLDALIEQPISKGRLVPLKAICDEINSVNPDEGIYHVMTMGDTCYIIKKPEKG